MNAVEIEEAVSELAGAPFDAAEFPFAFLAWRGTERDLTLLLFGVISRYQPPGHCGNDKAH